MNPMSSVTFNQFDCRVYGVNEYLLQCQLPTSTESFAETVSAWGAVAAVVISLAVAGWTVYWNRADSEQRNLKDRREVLERQCHELLTFSKRISLREPESLLDALYDLEESAARFKHVAERYGESEAKFAARVLSLAIVYRERLEPIVHAYEMRDEDAKFDAKPAQIVMRWRINELFAVGLLRFPNLDKGQQVTDFCTEFDEKAAALQQLISGNNELRSQRELSEL